MNAAVEVMLTTTPGLEDIAAAELAERAPAFGIERGALHWPDNAVAGRVRVDVAAPADRVRALALALRSIHHAMRHVETAPLPAEAPLAHLDQRIRQRAWPEMDASTPFRVSSSRHGSHTFSSHDVQATAGAALQAITGAPVDLRGYGVHVVVDVVYDRYVIGVRWSDRPLGLRFERAYNQRVALKPPVAYGLLRLGAAGGEPRAVLDPFCGTGTILLEAASVFPAAELAGSDISEACIAGTQRNLAAAGLDGRAVLTRGDARALDQLYGRARFDLIAANPPYGRRLGRGIRFTGFYTDFLRAAAAVLAPGGRLAILVGKRGAFNTALARVGGWHVRHVRMVDMNHVHAGLFVVERSGGGDGPD